MKKQGSVQGYWACTQNTEELYINKSGKPTEK